jgi:hypothetical protein
MDEWHGSTSVVGIVTEAQRRQHTASVTPEGAAWLASASAFPRSVEALWSARPCAPSVLPCGRAFDVVNLTPLFGRRVLEQLWAEGPGSGPAAVHRGRVLLLVAPGTAQRLPALLRWEEWARDVPPMLCHGAGDAVTVPALYEAPWDVSWEAPWGERREEQREAAGISRWLVAPDTRHPWLPGADVLLWACLRAVRADRPAMPAGAAGAPGSA